MSQYFAKRETEELQRRVAADEKLLARCLALLEDHCTAHSGADMLQLVADLRGRLEINSGFGEFGDDTN